jgi:biopolymer transport protein ExbB/TolQ
MTNTSAMIRPAWTPATIALMVLGFMVFWPLGLAMLAYVLWGERLDGFKRDINASTDSFFANFNSGRGSRRHGGPAARTGNVAFDDWRSAELDRLNEERRKLEEMREEFETYARELRRAKDQEDFDRFMRSRNDDKTRRSGFPDITNGDNNG